MYIERQLTSDRPLDEQFAEIGAECGFGPSPGGAAAILGITRQSVDYAIKKGNLKAYKVYYPNSEDACIFVDSYSLERYRELRTLTTVKDGRIPYRAKAI